jgi:hypothetical protein
MSIIHTFVCDYCGSQNHLSDNGDDYDGQEESEDKAEEAIAWTPTATPGNFAAKSTLLKASVDEEFPEIKESPTLYYSVRLDFAPVKTYNPLRIVRQYVRNFSFCSKSCFGSFIEKNMDDNGRITKNKITEIT